MKSMRGSRKSLILVLCIVCSATLILSCSKPEDKILGKWQEIGGTETIEFLQDGTVTVVDEGMTMGGTYKIVEENQIEMDLVGTGALAAPVSAKGTLTGDDITFTMPNGEFSHYSRMK